MINRRQFIKNASVSAIGAAGIGAVVSSSGSASVPESVDTSKILNYNPDMEYRRLGSTGLMVSAVCMGGHTGDTGKGDFNKNRRDVINRCMEVGINYIDACCEFEVMYCCKALKGRREKMYVALSDCEREIRHEPYRTSKKLLQVLDNLLKKSGQEYTDLWRPTAHERGGRHSFNTCCELVNALEKAKKQGKARFIGFSTHDRRWIQMMVREFPQLDVILFPFTSMSKKDPRDTVFDVLKKHNTGVFGIKPFAAGSIFRGDSQPDSDRFVEDNRMARLALRYILRNPDIIPIPGLSHVQHVDNVAKAVKERRQLDKSEQAALKRATTEGMANLPANYAWLRDWEYV